MPSGKQNILVILFLLLCFKSYCGDIRGVIKDKESGEPLAGAVVALHDTKYGTATGLDGSYEIKNVPAGDYDLQITFPSLKMYTQHITVKDGEPLVINQDMEPLTKALDEVRVTGKYNNGTDEQARNIEKSSNVEMNIMAARTIELLPDITVSNVLQRVSGVQMQRDANGDARYASIRGMDRRYNYTEVDGVVIPSPNDAGRYVPLDIFPAEIVDRIEVIKSLTPDMEANAIGGATNLVMKKAPDHFVIYATAATGYNENLFTEHFNSFYKGAIVANDPTTMHGPSYNATNSDFPLGSSVIRPIQGPPNSLYSLSIGNRFLKDKKLGVMFSGSYQNTYKETNDLLFAPASEPAIGNISEFDDLYLRKYSTQDTRAAAHVNADYHFNDKNTISVYGLYTQLNQWQERNEIDSVITAVNRPGPGLGGVDYKDRTTFTKEHIGNITLKGEHVITNGLKLDWTGAYSKAERDIPDYTEMTSEDQFAADSKIPGKVDEQGRDLKSMTKSWEKTNDQDLQGMLNLSYSTDIFGQFVEFQGGGMYRAKTRDNYFNEYSITPKGTRIPYTTQSATDTASWFLTPGAGLGDAYGNGLTYKENENISAYYAQAKAHLLDDKLEALVGVRIEHTYVYDSVDLDPKLTAGVSGTYNYTDVLPGVHLKYKLSKKENLRLSYFESIARPQYSELLNNTQKTETFDLRGNPYLNHAIAQNFDARYEFFPKGIDQLLIGAFYKIIQDPIEYRLIPTGTSAQAIQPYNDTSNAINYGAEIVITKYFHYFGVSANYTYTHSAITVPEAYLGVNPNNKNASQVYDVTEVRPQQGQAANIGNLSLLYKNPKWGLNANLSLQYTGRFITLTSPWQGLDYWQKATTFLDFACDKQIVKHLFIYIKVQNILNSKTIVEINESNSQFTNPNNPTDYFGNQNLKDGKILVEQTQTGRNYIIGLRYKID